MRLLRLEKIEKQLVLLIVLMLFLATNYLIAGFSLRLDFSNGQAYTLSPATKKILSQLDDLVTIKFFVSSDLPTRFLPIKSEAIDFINEYKKAGRGRLMVKIIDPKKDQAALDQVRESGIPELQFSQLEQDKYAVSRVYFGLSIHYGDKSEMIPQLTDLESLEYNLTAAIYKLTKKQLTKVGVIGKTDEFDQTTDTIASLKQVLRQQFELQFINLEDEELKKISPDVKTVVVFTDAGKQYSQSEIEKIKDYLNRKGNGIFFAQGVKIDDNLQTNEENHNLFGFFKEWGIELQKNLLLSTSAELVNFGNAQVQFLTAYPFWIKTNYFNPEASYFSNITQLTFPWTSSLKTLKKNNYLITELVRSNAQTWERTGNQITLDPQSITEPTEKEMKQFLLVAQSKKKDGGKIVVIGSARFVLERFFSRNTDNLEFVINLINDMASGGALTGIRKRAVAFYPLPEIPSSAKDIFKYLNILLLPGVWALIGGLRLVKKH